jgi:hypothetical protein
MRNYRHNFIELIERAKLHSPQSFPYLQDIEEFLDDVVIIPKHKFKMKNFNFETKKDELLGVIKVKGTITFGGVSTIDTRLTDSEYLENCAKEEIRLHLIDDIQWDNKCNDEEVEE